eukprot:1743715-Heterocapsa_arctica.AAC.1
MSAIEHLGNVNGCQWAIVSAMGPGAIEGNSVFLSPGWGNSRKSEIFAITRWGKMFPPACAWLLAT